MRGIFIILFILLTLLSFSQVNTDGVPLITNYTSKHYNAHNENWCCAVNKYGILYFGNSSGYVLEYDGKNWNKIPTKLKSVVYSLACDSNGIVYVGCQGDFGLIKPNNFGKMLYYSLAEQLKDSLILKQIFWKTYINSKHEVYFCSPQNVYRYYNNKIKSIKLPPNSWLSFYIDDKLYVSNSELGLFVLEKDKFIPVKGFEALKGSDIQIIDKISNDNLLIFNGNNFYEYNLKTQTLNQIKENYIWKYLKQNYAYTTDGIYGKLKAWSTINGGVVITSNKWTTSYIINDSVGLNSSGISSVKISAIDGTIWATTLNGISKIEYQNPFRYFGQNQSLKGIIYKIKKYKGKLYVATSTGLYVLELYTFNSYFKKIDYFKNNIVNYLEIVNINGKELLWISSQSSLFQYDGQNFKKLFPQTEIITEYIYYSDFTKNIYIGAFNGLYIYNPNKNILEKYPNIKESILSILEDDEHNIWFSTSSNGIYCIDANNKLTHYTDKDGLPVLNDIFLYKHSDKILLCTSKGLYYYDKISKSFKEYNHLGEWLTNKNNNIIFCQKGYNNQLWFNINNKLYLLIPHNNSYDVDSLTFKRLPELSIYSIYTEPTGKTWIGTSEGLFSYNPKIKPPDNKFYTLIRSVTLSKTDSTIFYGQYYDPLNLISFKQTANSNYILDYKYNSLIFTFSTPYYQEEKKIEYSYYLEGFSESWSNWTKEDKAIFTNLPEGKYVFKVKARNVYLQESEIASFTFEIKPPWYRTIIAYILYVLSAAALFIVSLKLYTKKLEADKRRLEKIVEERTAEIVKQKNEIEEKNKVIEQKNKDITDSIYYAKRIQEAILPPKQYIEGANVDIFIYFRPKDIVSGDFYFIKNIKRSNILVVAAADCTGHGVPGAFMSMLGSSLLNEIVTKPEVNHTDIVLNELREGIIHSLNPEGKHTETKDGMDIAFIAYDYLNKKLEFSGANNPMYLIRNNELIEYKADKMPVGLYERKDAPFSRVEIDVLNEDIIYLFSDGFADQFGGENGKKYMYKRFKEFLLSIHKLPMEEQEKLIDEEAKRWRGDQYEQIDDQLIIGVRFFV